MFVKNEKESNSTDLFSFTSLSEDHYFDHNYFIAKRSGFDNNQAGLTQPRASRVNPLLGQLLQLEAADQEKLKQLTVKFHNVPV